MYVLNNISFLAIICSQNIGLVPAVHEADWVHLYYHGEGKTYLSKVDFVKLYGLC